jgi:predicted dehydrogenase
MAESKPVGIGIVGAGVISEVYMKNLSSLFPNTYLVGVSDIIPERAEKRAEEFKTTAMSNDEIFNHPEVELVVCLTPPLAHAEIGMAALNAGKNFYTEKPFATDRADGQKMIELAREKGLQVGSAPDTFMGGGLQMSRALIDQGLIGEPIAVDAAIRNHGMEAWHPEPDFFFAPGAGPLLDVGVYYVTAMATILGPYKSVSAVARATFPERTIGNGAREGEKIPVTTPTHISAVIEFESGVLGSLTASFDLWETDFARLTIYGTEGTLRLPDPNTFGGPIQYLQGGTDKWVEIPVTVPNTENSRGLGANDLAKVVREGGKSRVDGSLGFHVLDFMSSVLESAERGQRVEIESTFEKPELAEYAQDAKIPADVKRGVSNEQNEMIKAAFAATKAKDDAEKA